VGGPPDGGPALLLLTFGGFLRQAVADDPHLSRQLQFDALECLGEQLTQVHADQLDLRAAQERLAAEAGARHGEVVDLFGQVLAVLGRLAAQNGPVRPELSHSLTGEADRRRVARLLRTYRELPEAHRLRLPALGNGIGKLELAVGAFPRAGEDFAAGA
jgi:hypothetical protein